MLTYEQALDRILRDIQPLDVAQIPLRDCLGRTLARDLVSTVNLPPFDNSAMDGYAVRAADTRSATPTAPVVLRIVEEIPAGNAPLRSVESGTAARLYTGSAMPPGADAVVPVEDTAPTGTTDSVAVTASAEPGAFVRRAGGDVRSGDVVLSAGVEARPYEIAVAAAVGRPTLAVYRAPRVAVLSTGNELVEPADGAILTHGKIFNSNREALVAQVTAAKCDVSRAAHALDTKEGIRAALAQAGEGSDVVLTSGGVSVGDHDLIKPVVEADGRGRIDFWRVAIRPGKPFVFGTYGDALFFGLPGNPVSTMVTFELFVRPALRRLAGHPVERCPRPLIDSQLLGSVSHDPGRRSFQRAVTESVDGRFITRAVGGQASHMLRGMTQANSLLIVPEDMSSLADGARVKAILLD